MCPRCLGMVPADAPEAPAVVTPVVQAKPAMAPPIPTKAAVPSHVTEATHVTGKVQGKGWIILVAVLLCGACCLPCGGLAIIGAVLFSRDPSVGNVDFSSDSDSSDSDSSDSDSSVSRFEFSGSGSNDLGKVEGDPDMGSLTLAAWQEMRRIDAEVDVPLRHEFWEQLSTKYQGIDRNGVDPQFATLIRDWIAYAAQVRTEVDSLAEAIRNLPNDDQPSAEEALKMADSYLQLEGLGLFGEAEESRLANFREIDLRRQELVDREQTLATEFASRYGLKF